MSLIRPIVLTAFTAVVLSCVCLDAAWAQVITGVPRNSVWKYDDTGTDLGTAWRDSSYNDTGWSSGPGLLGYGENYIDTPISFGGNSSNKHPTAYFRTSFDLPLDPNTLQFLELGLNYDDAIVVYFNGQEVVRHNLPGGSITYNTFASGNHESGNYETDDVLASKSDLVMGTNWIAVEVHQRSASSSDLVMDLELKYSTELPPSQVTRGPYLMVGTDTSMTVRWRTNNATTSELKVGTSLGSLSLIAQDGALKTEHELTVGGLAAETVHYYSVGEIGVPLVGDDVEHQFKTNPSAGASRTTRVWVIGDSGEANTNARRVRDGYLQYASWQMPDLWLMLGDNAYNTGTDAEYQAAVFDMYPELLRKSSVWPTRGNHDDFHSGSNNDYYEIFTLPMNAEAGGVSSGDEAYYSFDYGDIHFICLDSDGQGDTWSVSPGSAMMTWLEADLLASNAMWTVAFWHHPPYTKGSHDSDSEGRLIDMREMVLPTLEAGGVDLVLTGHSHSYERSFLLDEHYDFSWTLVDSMKVDDGDGSESGNGAYEKSTFDNPHEGAVYIVAGNASKISGGSLNHPAMFTSQNVLGSVVLDFDGLRMDVSFIDTTGTERDQFTMIKGSTVSADGNGPRPVLSLAGAAPNPFRDQTQVAFQLSRPGDARVSVFDAAGATRPDRCRW